MVRQLTLHHQGDESSPMMEAESTSETSVNYQTTRSNTGNSCLFSRRRENLKSHQKSLGQEQEQLEF
jgi:hypothetical protein